MSRALLMAASPPQQSETVLGPEERALIRELRAEVLSIKDCIAKYTIQCLAFVTAALSAILAVQVTGENAIAVGLAALLALFVLRAVSRTAVHKLGTINRNLGYEMHLHRSCRLSEGRGWKHEYQRIGWEEAMRAWRIVQASVFAALCNEASGWFGVGDYRKEYIEKASDRHPRESRPYLWYDVRYLVESATHDLHPERGTWLSKLGISARSEPPPATYHAGSYVRKMLLIMHRAMFACLVPMGITCYRLAVAFLHALESDYSALALFTTASGRPGGSSLGGFDLLWRNSWSPFVALVSHASSHHTAVFVPLIGCILLFALAFMWVAVAVDRDDVRLDQLESGILSIHSCAVLWQVVVVAHFRALAAWRGYRNSPFLESSFPAVETGYTYNLARQAAKLAKGPLNIHRWILDARDTKRKNCNIRIDIEIEQADGTKGTISAELVDATENAFPHPYAGVGAALRSDAIGLAGVGVVFRVEEVHRIGALSRIKHLVVREGQRFNIVRSMCHPVEFGHESPERTRLGMLVEAKKEEWKPGEWGAAPSASR